MDVLDFCWKELLKSCLCKHVRFTGEIQLLHGNSDNQARKGLHVQLYTLKH